MSTASPSFRSPNPSISSTARSSRAACFTDEAPPTMKLGDWLAEQRFALAMSSGFFSFFAHAGMLDVLVTRALVAGAWASGVAAGAAADRLVALRREDFWDPAPGAGLLAGRKFDRLLR